jgi:hypothetical protein
MKIFLDDRRKIDKKYNYNVANDYEECILFLDVFKNDIELISLDYDLSNTCDNTGYDVLVYMAENKIYPKQINIHSDHSIGVPRMKEYAKMNFPGTNITTNKVPQ